MLPPLLHLPRASVGENASVVDAAIPKAPAATRMDMRREAFISAVAAVSMSLLRAGTFFMTIAVVRVALCTSQAGIPVCLWQA